MVPTAAVAKACDFDKLKLFPEDVVKFGRCGRISSRYLLDTRLLIKTDLSHTLISTSDFNRFKIKKVSFVSSRLDYSSFNDGTITQTDFTGADLKAGQFVNTSISRTKFKNTNLSRAFFSHCRLENVDFTDANLQGATFNQCYIKKVKFPKVKNYSFWGNILE